MEKDVKQNNDLNLAEELQEAIYQQGYWAGYREAMCKVVQVVAPPPESNVSEGGDN